MVKYINRKNKIQKEQNKTDSEKEEEEEGQKQNDPIKCFIRGCRTYFSNINNLKRHLLMHSEEKNEFVCNFQKCYSHFKNIISLYRHFIEKHKDNLIKNEIRFLFDRHLFENLKCIKSNDRKNLLQIKDFINKTTINKNLINIENENVQNKLNEIHEEKPNINNKSNSINFGFGNFNNMNQNNFNFINPNQNLNHNINFNLYGNHKYSNYYINHNYYPFAPNILNGVNTNKIINYNKDRIYQPINNVSIINNVKNECGNNQYTINIPKANYLNLEQSNVNFYHKNWYLFKDNKNLSNDYLTNNNLFNKLLNNNFNYEINSNSIFNNQTYLLNNINNNINSEKNK